MNVDGPVEAEGFVWPDVVEHLAVGLGLPGKILKRLDLGAVEVLVLQGAEGAFPDAVLAGAPSPGTDVDEL